MEVSGRRHLGAALPDVQTFEGGWYRAPGPLGGVRFFVCVGTTLIGNVLCLEFYRVKRRVENGEKNASPCRIFQ